LQFAEQTQDILEKNQYFLNDGGCPQLASR